MTIHVWDYRREFEAERDDIFDAIEQVMRSGRLVLGESVRQFEIEFAHYCGVRHGVGVANGTNAISLGLKALGIVPGDEVITVSNTAAPTVVAAVAIGAGVRFVDIAPNSYLMNTDQLESVITDRTRCILPVHLFGQCVNMDAVHRVASEHGLAVLEDCAQSHGARFGERMAGSMSDAAAFSFYPTKILGAYGDGGIVLTDREETERKLRCLRQYGMEDRYYVVEQGFNSRLDELHAEILRRKLTRLDEYVRQRRLRARRYDEMLTDTSLVLPEEVSGNYHAYYLYVVRHPLRDRILSALREQDIVLNISYPWPIHTMSGFDHLGYAEGDLPRTEAAAREIFSLPMYPSLTEEDQQTVCEALRKTLRTL